MRQGSMSQRDIQEASTGTLARYKHLHPSQQARSHKEASR